MAPPSILADPPVLVHTSWCATALHERRGLACASLTVQVAGVFVWIAQTRDGPRLVASGDAVLDGVQIADLVRGVAQLLGRQPDRLGAA
ncbi:MAG TPA: hypothetical protein VHN80_18835 [Kineosporiaceae bacterium]|jgi:hypothetical protein|nr:hypothetical protein [Kineosporiaceae bacterium]